MRSGGEAQPVEVLLCTVSSWTLQLHAAAHLWAVIVTSAGIQVFAIQLFFWKTEVTGNLFAISWLMFFSFVMIVFR